MSLAHDCIKLHVLLTLPWDSLLSSMTTRLILSLKKASISPDSVWSIAGTGRLGTLIFAHHAVGGTECVGGDVALTNLSLKGVGGLSRSDDQNI